MSGAGENRWQRRPGKNQDRSSGANTPTGIKDKVTPAAGSSAWAGKGKAAPDHHVPVRDFNAREVKEFLAKKYIESIAGQPSVYYKVQGDSVAKRSSGAWGARPHLMPSGQDFFTQLRKQVATMDQSKPSQ